MMTLEEKIAEYLRDNLRIEVVPKISELGFSEGIDTVKLILNGEIISEASL